MDIVKSDAMTNQYIVVRLGPEQYGIDISYVNNILRMQRITRVPKAQPYISGVINQRGEIVPVMSMRLRFGMEPDVFTSETRILIVKIEAQAAMGIIVDSVREVVTLSEEDIVQTLNQHSSDDKASFLFGVGKHQDDLISILNVASVIVEREQPGA